MTIEIIVFGAGCFLSVELAFSKVHGVINTTSGHFWWACVQDFIYPAKDYHSVILKKMVSPEFAVNSWLIWSIVTYADAL